MAGASFSMDMSPLKGLTGRMLARAQQTQGMAEEIGEMLVSSTQQRFEDQRGPDGKPWKPSKRAEQEGGQTLVDTAGMKNSIGYEASPTAVAVGTNKIYGAIHQKGGQAGRGRKVTIPARPFLGITGEDTKAAQEIIQDHLAGAIR